MAELNTETSRIIVIIRPFSSAEFVQNLPNEPEYLQDLTSIVKDVTQLDTHDFSIKEDTNPLTSEPDCQFVFVTLPSKNLADKLYQAQPFLGCLIAHKLSSIQVCPFLRYHSEQCLMCISKKTEECVYDMCQDCSSRQKYATLNCPCSRQLAGELTSNRQLKVISLSKFHEEDDQTSHPSQALCEKCSDYQDKGCANKMCAACCPVQAIRLNCSYHDESVHSRSLRSL